jgi:hypothetical protein
VYRRLWPALVKLGSLYRRPGEHSLAVVITDWEVGVRAAQMQAESCRISHHVQRVVFNQIVRDAEIAYAISPIVRKHHLTAEETEKFLLELRIPRAANVAQITDCLVVSCSQKANSELAAQN